MPEKEKTTTTATTTTKWAISKKVLIIGIAVGAATVVTIVSVLVYVFAFRKSGSGESGESGGSGGSGSSEITQFEKDCLISHNNYRALHGTPKLTISKTISKFSQEWAEELSRVDKMEHRQQQTYGENIYSASGTSTVPCENAVGAWYGEIKDYKYDDPKFDFSTGHFTQVVWKDTKEVGCGFAEKNKKVYIVCNYLPPGNWEGAFADGVPKPL